MSLTKATFAMIRGSVANVLDFGADNTGAANSKSAIDAALSSGAGTVFLPKGTYKYVGQMTIPSGVNMYGAGMYESTIDCTHNGYAIIIQGIGSEIADLGVLCSKEGVKFQTPAPQVGYT